MSIECENCRFFYYSGCRRFPPMPAVYTDRDGEVTSQFAWPSVEASDWCGEYAPRLPVDEEAKP